jgi:hypothetical protein
MTRINNIYFDGLFSQDELKLMGYKVDGFYSSCSPWVADFLKNIYVEIYSQHYNVEVVKETFINKIIPILRDKNQIAFYEMKQEFINDHVD